MRASLFFKMYENMIILENLENINKCDIQAISIMNSKGYEIIRNSYLDNIRTIAMKEKDKTIKEEGRVVLSQEQAKDILFEFFAIKKGIMK